MKNLWSIPITLLILIAFAACRKNTPTETYLTDEIKKAFNYDTGTYWVFYDSLSHTTDSLYVTDNHRYAPYSDGSTPREEIYIDLLDTALGKKVEFEARLGLDFGSSLNIEFPPGTINAGDDQIVLLYDLLKTSSTVGNSYSRTYSSNLLGHPNVYDINFHMYDYNTRFVLSTQGGFLGIQLQSPIIQKKMSLLRYRIVLR